MEQQHSTNGVVVVIVPLPAQGHLNQLLHLSRVISTRGISVHYVASAIHNRQAKDRVQGWSISTVSNLHFHDFLLPEVIHPPPDPMASHKFPSHLLPAFRAVPIHFHKPLGELLRSLAATNRRVVVVHDSLMSFSAEEASFIPNAEAYCFTSFCAFSKLYLMEEAFGIPMDEGKALILRDIPPVYFEDCAPQDFIKFVAESVQFSHFDVGHILNTCEKIEARFISMLAEYTFKTTNVWAIGPLNPITSDATKLSDHKCIEWLDKQPPSSVLYVSFGTMTSIPDNQIAEIALGLERSAQRFIWVLRDADRADIYNTETRKVLLPDGYEERIKDVGMIVKDWAPQLQILAHVSTGGFMSHCGWNSCMESLSMGVPIAAWPMHSDQPRNAFLLKEVLKVGILVQEWKHRHELVSSAAIESSVTKLMVSEEGEAIRRNASELGRDIREAVAEGGCSSVQFQYFLSHISR